MTKIYKAKKTIYAVFFSECTDSESVVVQAGKYIAKEAGNFRLQPPVEVCEVFNLSDLPQGFDGGCSPWGGDGITCSEWFEKLTREKITALKEEIAKLTAELSNYTFKE